MIEYTNLISDEDGYKKFNHFEVSEELQSILADNYFLYNTEHFEKIDFVEELYKKNFIDKYDRDAHKEIFESYIDNKEFKEKAQFVYSIIDIDKYAKFVDINKEIKNPNDLTIKYSIIDSDGVKVEVYFLSIIDISFVF